MAKRRTAGIQRRQRASEHALNRRLASPRGMALPDWRLLTIGGVLLIGLSIIVLVLLFGSAPNPNTGSSLADDGGAHVNDGASCRAEPASCGLTAAAYSGLPATSGPMWNTPASWGVYSTPVNESQIVHNLEHGGVVIWYDPAALDAAALDRLTRYVNTQTASGIGGRYKFILSPWGGEEVLGAPVVVTAWRSMVELQEADTGAIDDFVRARYGRSPENGGPGPPAT